MLSLNDREWAAFFIEDVATIESGRDIYEDERVEGATPYISSTAMNNGISYFVSNNNATQEANCISVNRNGSVGYAFYHPYPALYSNDCRKIRLKRPSRYLGIFIATQITSQRGKYSYGYKMGTGRLKRQMILLPINDSGDPDWKFMEDYIREREKRLIQDYIEYIGNNNQQRMGVPTLNQKKWAIFVIGDIFTLETGKGKGLNHLRKQADGISYLGATNRNNGVLCFVEQDKRLIQKGNSIAFIRNGEGSIGFSVYKAEPFIASSDLTIGYNEHLNRFNALFITTIADRVRGKYNFNYKRSDSRLEKESILLPVDDLGSPDWKYMEYYVKAAQVRQHKQYLQHVANRA
ncbi:MAG: restriction endonuclease subunit S [Oscillospiraceae bacterium]|nr:restriction endonuclease subunit S [Oscillospiraceae bacterium]